MIYTFEDTRDLADRLARMYRCDPKQMTADVVYRILRKAEKQHLRAALVASALTGILSSDPDANKRQMLENLPEILADYAVKSADATLARMEQAPDEEE